MSREEEALGQWFQGLLSAVAAMTALGVTPAEVDRITRSAIVDKIKAMMVAERGRHLAVMRAEGFPAEDLRFVRREADKLIELELSRIAPAAEILDVSRALH